MRKIIKKVSIVIPAFNEEKLIARCLKSLCEQTMKREEYEIIVVNNNSTDKTEEIAKKYADKVIFEKRQGQLFARQTGFEAAESEIILRTDADCVVPKNWVKKGYNFLHKNKKIVAVSGFYYPDNNDFGLIYFSWFTIQYKTIIYKIAEKIEWLTSSCSGIKKSAFLKIGGFDLKQDVVIEDQLGIGYRLNKVGKVAFDKDWFVWTSPRRVVARKNSGLKDFMNDYLLYQIYNNFYFYLFKKRPRKIYGKGWENIRENE